MPGSPEWRPYVRPSRPDPREDVDDEIAFHLEMLTQDLIAHGLAPAAAREEAERRFGGLAGVRDACLHIDQRRRRRVVWRESMSALWQDVRYATRSVRKNPVFSLVVCLTLALGIGTTTAMFGVVDGVLLRQLPYARPDQLVELYKIGRNGNEDLPVSYPDYLDWHARGGAVFAGVGAWVGTGEQIVADGRPELLQGSRVSANMAELLGVKPILGRSFRPEEELATGPRVVLIGEHLWRARFGADPRVLGRTIDMSGEPYTIVGVLPASAAARLPSDLRSDRDVDFWMPLRFTTKEEPRDLNFMDLIARLRPGITLPRARAGIDAVVLSLKQDGIEVKGMHAVPLSTVVVANAGRPLAILLGAVAVLLLIACANVANLLLARAVTRQRELAIRVALGAARSRLVVQLLVEALMQAIVGGLAGIGLAIGLTWAARRWLAVTLPRFDSVRIDGRVLAFALAVSVAAGLLFGLAPALRASRQQASAALREGGRGFFGSLRRDRLRRMLVITEVALSFVLLVGAGLLLRTLDALLTAPRGFDAEHVLTAQVGLPQARYPDSTAVRRFYERLLTEVRGIPGVQGAALASELPGVGGTFGGVTIEGQSFAHDQRPMVEKRIVSAGYFETLGAKLVAGRLFGPGDAAGAPPVVIVNRTFADRWLHGSQAVGHRAGFLWGIDGEQTIVGVIDDVREGPPDAPPRPAIYIPAAQRPDSWMKVVVRSNLDEATLARALRVRLSAIDPQLALSDIQTLDEFLGSSVAARRATATILGTFALLALLLASVGLYGVISYSVTQRTQELGVRAALGAQRGDQLRLVLRQGASVLAAGLLLGFGVAAGATRLLASQLFGVGPTDPWTFVAVALLLALVCLGATLVPAMRATHADPMTALRTE